MTYASHHSNGVSSMFGVEWGEEILQVDLVASFDAGAGVGGVRAGLAAHSTCGLGHACVAGGRLLADLSGTPGLESDAQEVDDPDVSGFDCLSLCIYRVRGSSKARPALRPAPR